MADFEDQLSGLFMEARDEALGDRLADAALAQVERENARRRLVLVSGAAVGVVATLSIVDVSGALATLQGLGAGLLRISPTYAWEAAAGLFALYALASLRRSRTV